MEKDNVLISKQKFFCFIPGKYVTNDYGNVLALLTVFTQEPSEAQRKKKKSHSLAVTYSVSHKLYN